ncbi:hypothetical protein AAC861_000551 [Vibrio cholerae]
MKFSNNIWILRVQLLFYVIMCFVIAFVVALLFAVIGCATAFVHEFKEFFVRIEFKAAMKRAYLKFKGDVNVQAP